MANGFASVEVSMELTYAGQSTESDCLLLSTTSSSQERKPNVF